MFMPLAVIVGDHTFDTVLSGLPEEVRELAWREVTWAAASSCDSPVTSTPLVDVTLSLAALGLDMAPPYLHISALPSKRSVRKLLGQSGHDGNVHDISRRCHAACSGGRSALG